MRPQKPKAEPAEPRFRLNDPDHETLYQFLQQWLAINTVVELRAMESPSRKFVQNAYLPSEPSEAFTPCALRNLLESTDGVNLYVSVNRAHPGVICRSPLLWTPGGKGLNQQDITRITHLVLDLDPVRPAGIPSSDAEHRDALRAADWLIQALEKYYDARPRIVLDTGNGVQLLYPLDEPNSPETSRRVKSALAYLQRGLEKMFPSVKLDPATINPAQLTRLPFTTNAKGYPWGDRTHRTVRLLATDWDAPNAPLARWQPAPKPDRTPPETDAERPEPLEILLQQLDAAGVRYRTPRPLNADGDWVIPLEQCVFDPAHTAGHQNPGVLLLKGRIGYKCFHSDCVNRNGRAFREWLAATENGTNQNRSCP